MKELVEIYNKKNSSYKKTFVFRLGNEAGFFSEFNNMVLALIFCLKNNIRFSFFSKHANFALNEGWNDFFLPFCKEDKREFHRTYNFRPFLVNSRKKKYLAKAYKLVYGIDYLTQDLWDSFTTPACREETFCFPELKLKDADLLDAAKQIISLIWRYNPQSKTIIDQFKDSIKLPDDFISIHIRSGDKSIEDKLFNIDEYMTVAAKHSQSKNAFILTDDFTVLEELNKKYNTWNFFTLCYPSERGYYHKDFQKKDKEVKYMQHLKLFANIEICANSKKFIGTYSSNIGMYMGMKCGESFCDCLDSESWIIR